MNVDLAGLGNLDFPAGFIQRRRYKTCDLMRKPVQAAPGKASRRQHGASERSWGGGDLCIPMAGSC